MLKKLYAGFFTIFLCILTLLIAVLSYFEYIDIQILLANSLISEKAVSIALINGNVITEEELKKITEDNPEITIFSEIYLTKELSVFGFCGNASINVNSFIQGRFFTEEDFFTSKNIAVVSEKITALQLNKLTKNNYEIIGSIIPSTNTVLENTAFVNLDSLDIKSVKQFTIDSKNSNSITSVIEKIKKDFDVHIYHKNNNFIERYAFGDIDLQKTTEYTIIFMLLSIMLLSVFILQYYSKEIRVKKMIGVKLWNIYFDLIKSTCLLTFTSTLIFIVGYSFLYNNFLIKMHLTFYLFEIISFSGAIFLLINAITYFYLTTQKWNYKL